MIMIMITYWIGTLIVNVFSYGQQTVSSITS
jgi:hypothetical protein